jgi:hypothetical protein
VVAPTRKKAAIPKPPRRLVLFATGAAAAIAVALLLLGVEQSVLSHNHRWIAPMLLAKSDPRVVSVAAALQQETAAKNALLLSKKDLEARLAETRRWLDLEAAFQTSFTAALRSDLDGQRAELRRLRKLAADRSQSGVPAQDDPDLAARLDAVSQRVRLLEQALRQGRTPYQTLALRREYDRSLVETDRGREVEKALVKSIADVDASIAQKDTLLASIESSPYRLAVDTDVPLAFVPYDNLSAARAGEPVVACATTLFFCDKVGTIDVVLAGEVHGRHPSSGDEARGQLVRLKLADPRFVERPMLFAGRSPVDP